MTQPLTQPRPHASIGRRVRGVVLMILVSMLLGALGVAILFWLCFAMGRLGFGMLGFWIFTAPGSALSPFFSFLTRLMPTSLFHALFGTSSVGSSFAQWGFWSMVSWFVLFWIIAFVALRWRRSRRRMTSVPDPKGTAQVEPHDRTR